MGKVDRVALKRRAAHPPWLWWRSWAAVLLVPEWLASWPSVGTGCLTSPESSLLRNISSCDHQEIQQKQSKVLIEGSSLGFLFQCHGPTSGPGLLNNGISVLYTADLEINVVQAQLTCCSLFPQLAHEREEAESGGLLVIKDCFDFDCTE